MPYTELGAGDRVVLNLDASGVTEGCMLINKAPRLLRNCKWVDVVNEGGTQRQESE